MSRGVFFLCWHATQQKNNRKRISHRGSSFPLECKYQLKHGKSNVVYSRDPLLHFGSPLPALLYECDVKWLCSNVFYPRPDASLLWKIRAFPVQLCFKISLPMFSTNLPLLFPLLQHCSSLSPTLFHRRVASGVCSEDSHLHLIFF